MKVYETSVCGIPHNLSKQYLTTLCNWKPPQTGAPTCHDCESFLIFSKISIDWDPKVSNWLRSNMSKLINLYNIPRIICLLRGADVKCCPLRRLLSKDLAASPEARPQNLGSNQQKWVVEVSQNGSPTNWNGIYQQNLEWPMSLWLRIWDGGFSWIFGDGQGPTIHDVMTITNMGSANGQEIRFGILNGRDKMGETWWNILQQRHAMAPWCHNPQVNPWWTMLQECKWLNMFCCRFFYSYIYNIYISLLDQEAVDFCSSMSTRSKRKHFKLTTSLEIMLYIYIIYTRVYI